MKVPMYFDQLLVDITENAVWKFKRLLSDMKGNSVPIWKDDFIQEAIISYLSHFNTLGGDHCSKGIEDCTSERVRITEPLLIYIIPHFLLLVSNYLVLSEIHILK